MRRRLNAILIDPYYVGLEALLLAIREPSVALLRYPAAACGLLAIGLLYRLAARSLDRPTAGLAAGLMAVLPAAIIFSRIGYYSAVTPLFCVIALDCAFRRRLPALVVAIVGGYLIHPTTLFFLPVPLAVLMTRPDPATGVVAIDRRGVLAASVTAVVAAAAGLVLVARVPQMRAMVGTGGGGPLGFLLGQDRYGPSEFLALYGRFLLGIGTDMFPIPGPVLRRHDLAVWGLLVPLAGFGTAALVRRRRWDRLALVLGTAASLAGYWLMAGKLSFRTAYMYDQRYAVFLLVPTALSVACLARALLVPSGTVAASVQRVALLGLAASLVLCAKVHWFDHYTAAGYESLWTLRTDARDPREQAVDFIRADALRHRLRQGGPAEAAILTEHHWSYWPIQYLVGTRPGVHVLDLDRIAPDPDARRRLIREQMLAGAYVIADPESPLEGLVLDAFPHGSLSRWDAGQTLLRSLSVYRLEPGQHPAQDDPKHRIERLADARLLSGDHY